MSSYESIKLVRVGDKDAFFLYELLGQRDPRANISHRKMPTMREHKKFLRSRPYAAWYLIHWKNNPVGSVYLSKQDEIGIFLLKDFQGRKIGKKAIQILVKKHPRPRYLANVSPHNIRSRQFFEELGFSLIQYTFEKMK